MSTQLYRARYTDTQLLEEVIPAVARAADEDHPETVSVRDWDAAREDAGYGDAPGARAILGRFNKVRPVSWPEIVRGACFDDPRYQLVMWQRRRENPNLDMRHVHFALRRVAMHLNVDSLSTLGYGRGREQLIREAEPRGCADLMEDLLPTSDQIARIAGSFERAQLECGLKARPRPDGGRRIDQPLRRGVPIPEALAHFARLHGAFCGFEKLIEWARLCNIALGGRTQPWHEYRDEAASILRAAGDEVPQRVRFPYAKALIVPPAELFADATPRGEAVYEDYYSHEMVLDAITEYLQELTRGEQPRAKHYISLAAGRWPSFKVLQSHGQFQDLVREAQQRQRANGR